MGFFSGWLKKLHRPKNTGTQPSRKSGSLESRQSGSSGGMSTTELLIRLELILGQNSKLPLMTYCNEIATLSHPLQLSIFSELDELSLLSMEHAGQFLEASTSALTKMEANQYERWLADIKKLLKDGEKERASERIANYVLYIDDEDDTAVKLSDITYTLEKLVYSLHKKELPIFAADETTGATCYTDGSHLFLPAQLSVLDNHDDNFRLYKAMAFHLLGQLSCDSWQSMKLLESGIKKHGNDYLALFSKLESLRIDQYIKKAFPGLWRDIEMLQKLSESDYPDDIFGDKTDLSVKDSIELCDQLIMQDYQLPDLLYQSSFIPSLMIEQATTKLERQPLILNPTHDVDPSLLDTGGDPETAERGYLRPAEESSHEQVLSESQPSLWNDQQGGGEETLEHTTKHHEQGVYYYKEWDTSLKKYRKDWCRVKEVAEPVPDEDIQIENSDALRHAEHRIRKTFDSLINDQRFMRYQNDGDDIDIDAWVEARSNKNKSADDYQNLYIRNNRNTRDVAIMFAVDMSGSTVGWKNTMIKQSTWLLCKTLARLGDQYAVYGFSGSGRSNCLIYPVKTFSENYDKSVQNRIFSMKPHQYTRMGVAIRHLSTVLAKTTAKTRILFVLTDGRPDDIDSYRGQYGIDDTRLALNEAKAMSLKPFVLTFDSEGMDYLPYMLGSNRYQLITDISHLPIQISTIYKHLTT